MKLLRLTIALLFLGFIFGADVYARTLNPNCDALGRIQGIYRTSCFPWETADGTLTVSGSTVHNDTARLQDAITNALGKLVFDETDYYINNHLTLFSYRTIEGTGRSEYYNAATPAASHYSSKIVQTASNKSIFKIGASLQDIAIRDIALVTVSGTSGTIGVLAEGGGTNTTLGSTFNVEFSNITFGGLEYGIYVNALDNANTTPANEEGNWQFDNIKIDNSMFHNCQTGIYINSSNSGWSMKNLEFFVPAGSPLETDGPKTYGVYLKRSTYTTMNLLIGNGPPSGAGTAFIYVEQHFNLSIQNVVDEGFQNSIYIHGGNQDSPIYLANNYFQSPLTVNYSTIVSTANQFNGTSLTTIVPAYANNYSRIFSTGDKFCYEGVACTDATYQTDSSSQVVFSTNQYRTTMSNPLRLGASNFYYDIQRNIYWGTLDFTGNQGSGYSGYTFITPNRTVKINHDGSVTYGSKTYDDLINNVNLLSAPPSGTVVYCSNCQKTTPCSEDLAAPINGAIAKRVGSTWDCD